MSSRVITISRKQYGRYTKELDADATRKIGAYINSNGQVFVPLTYEEQDKWMPQVIDTPPSDLSFRQKVREWWSDLTTEVPQEGLSLEIGFDKQGNPLNVEEYFRYLQAKNHPRVADDKENNHGANTIWYITDPTRQKEEEQAENEKYLSAMETFIKMRKERIKLNNIVKILIPGINNPAELTERDLNQMLTKEIENDPDNFMKVAKDKQLQTKAFILDLISLGVVNKVGNSILHGEVVLGSNMEEAALYLDDKKNSETLLILQEQHKALKKTA